MMEIVPNTDLKVVTPTGLQKFSGVSRTWHERVVLIKTDEQSIKVGLEHKLLTENGWEKAKDIKAGQVIQLADGEFAPVFSRSILHEPQFMFDLLDVEGGNAYNANGIVSHNCEFISSEALLIDSILLGTMKTIDPLYENMGFRFWRQYKDIIGANKTYLMAVDPATGSGSDFTAINIVSFPDLEQVGEFRMNTVSIPLIYAKIKWVLEYLTAADATGGRADVVWTFERNGVGEALIALIQNDDEGDGVYLDTTTLYNENEKNPNRLGVFTNGRSKVLACMQLKNLIERMSGGLKIHSDILHYELQNFVAAGNSYAAKSGVTDDVVMSMVILMKLLTYMATYDDDARKVVYASVSPDSDLEGEDGDSWDGDIAPIVV
jgi:hypothetical protein